MGINSVSSEQSTAVLILTQTRTTSATGNGACADDPQAVGAAGAPVNVSGPGQRMGQLARLAQDDPEAFKKVTAEIAKKLADAAAQGGPDADRLKQIADAFQQASDTGDASALRPHHAHGHHGHHGGGSHDGSAASTGAAAYNSDSQNATPPSSSVWQTVQATVSSALADAGV